MPAVEARVGQIVRVGDRVLVEFFVVRMHELDVVQTFVLWHEAITDDLHLGLMGDGFEIGM